MKNVGVRELQDYATAYLPGSEPLAVNRHGRVIGFSFPVKRDQERIERDLDTLGAAVQAILEETGLSEDELGGFFALRRALP